MVRNRTNKPLPQVAKEKPGHDIQRKDAIRTGGTARYARVPRLERVFALDAALRGLVADVDEPPVLDIYSTESMGRS